MTLSDLSIRRPVLAWMAMISLMFFGFLSYQHLGVAQLPEISSPVITINVSWSGGAPEVMETEIVNPIEEAVISVEGVEDVEANMRQGTASIKLTFYPNKNIDAALQETNAKLRSVKLPDDVLPPTLSQVNSDDQPIMWLAITTTKRNFHDLISFVDLHIRSRFEVLPGVGSLVLGGWSDRSLRVWVDNNKLIQHQLTILDVKNTLKLENEDLASGYLENQTHQSNLRVMGATSGSGHLWEYEDQHAGRLAHLQFRYKTKRCCPGGRWAGRCAQPGPQQWRDQPGRGRAETAWR